MKNLKFIFAALVSIAALSCNKLESPVENPESNQDTEMMTLTLSAGEPTKTYIAENGTDIYWHSGDKIKVYSNYKITDVLGNDASAYDFSMSDDPQGNFARFTGKVRQGTSAIWAVYPSALAKGANTEGVINVNLPNTQTASKNSFSQNLNISVAKTPVELKYEFGDVTESRPVASGNVAFHNVCALLKFTVPDVVTNIKSVVISSKTDIAGDMTIDYGGDSPVFSSVSGSNAITMEGTFTAGQDYYFVLAPVAISELSIFVNTTDNKQYAATREFETPMQLYAGAYKSLGTLNIGNMPSFGIDFDIQDDNNFLNGTDVIFSFPSANVKNLKMTISKNGTTVRTVSIDGSVALNDKNQYISTYAKETVSSWPYLPQGTYTVSGSYETEAGAVAVSGLELKIEESPKFSVGSFEAKTSYTVYKPGDDNAVAEANALNGTSIYVSASGVGISEKILKNSNYKDLFKVQFGTVPATGYGSANLKDGLSAELTNQKYGAYIAPSYVFDGKKITFSDKTCYVTGLPFTLDVTANETDNPWVLASDNDRLYVNWNGSALKVGGNSPGKSVGTYKDFYVPSGSINVSASATGSVTGGRLDANTGTISLGGSTVSSAKATASYSISKSNTVSLPDSVKQLTISTQNSRLSCSVNYALLSAHMLVTSLTVSYR